MNASDIVTYVSDNINRSDTTTAMTLNWLNNRQKQICNFENFYFMEHSLFPISTVAATQSYSLPTGYKDELQLWLVDNGTKTPLVKWVGSEAEKSYSNPTQNGKPSNYWIWDQKYWLYPIPDAVYTLESKSYVYLADLTNTASELNELCKYWPDLLIYGGTAEGFHHFMMPDKAVEWETKFQNEFQKLTRRETKRKYTNYTPRLKLRMR